MYNVPKKIMLSVFVMCSMVWIPALLAIEGFIGEPPAKVLWIIEQLNETAPYGNKPRLKNRLILHGPPGNGKSLLAGKIAELTHRVFIQIDGPSIVNKFQGSGAEKIAQYFKDVLKGIEEHKHNALIFIDEIDAIACGNDLPGRCDYKAALQQLWLEMDKYKNDSRFFIVCATNHFKKLDTTFLDRFGNNIVEIKNPNAKARKEAIIYYFAMESVYFPEDALDELVEKTKGLSIRSLEDMAYDACIEACVHNEGRVTRTIILKTIKSIHKKFDENNEDALWRGKLERASLYVTVVGGSLLALVNVLQLHKWCCGILSTRESA